MTTATGQPLNIMWHSVSPWIPSGYGQQTAQVVRRLRDAGHNVAISGYAGIEGKIVEWEGVTVYPRDHTGWNKYALRKYVQRHSPDGTGDDVVVITLNDVHTWLDSTGRAGGMVADWRGLNIAAWVPVDHDPCPPNTVQPLQAFGARPIAMSRFGEDRMRKEGLDPLYVPHAIDTNVLRPNPEAAAEVRKKLGISPETFVVGMVANNGWPIAPTRKSFAEVFQAFAIFVERHPDSVLYLHTDILGLNGGLNLAALSETLGIPSDKMRAVDQDKYSTFYELDTEHMAYTFSALDVLANPSHGEGFGIPLIEAQACGTPVITCDWTAMSELVGPGWLVDGEPFFNPGSAAMWMKPAISEIIDRLEVAYAAKDDEKIAEACRRFALQYDADSVFEDYWVPTLEKLSKPREVPPLPSLNRETRRAKLKARGKTEVAA